MCPSAIVSILSAKSEARQDFFETLIDYPTSTGCCLSSDARCTTPCRFDIGSEAIYAFIYRAAHKGEDLWRYLTRPHKHRRPRRSRPSRDTIKDRVSIHQRPKNIDDRAFASRRLASKHLVLGDYVVDKP